MKTRSNYFEQKADVEKFNSENRWKKRGISIIPTKFGISFTAKHLNQAGALVQVSSRAYAGECAECSDDAAGIGNLER